MSFPLKWDFASWSQGEEVLRNVWGGGRSMVISYYQNNARPQFCLRTKNWIVKIQTRLPVFNVIDAWKAIFCSTGMTWCFGRMPDFFKVRTALYSSSLYQFSRMEWIAEVHISYFWCPEWSDQVVDEWSSGFAVPDHVPGGWEHKGHPEIPGFFI